MKKSIALVVLLCGMGSVDATSVLSRTQSYVKLRGRLNLVKNLSDTQVEIFRSASHSFDKVKFVMPGETAELNLVIPFENNDKSTDGLYIVTKRPITVKLNDTNVGISGLIIKGKPAGSVPVVVPLNIGIEGGYYVLGATGSDIDLTIKPDGTIVSSRAQ